MFHLENHINSSHPPVSLELPREICLAASLEIPHHIGQRDVGELADMEVDGVIQAALMLRDDSYDAVH